MSSSGSVESYMAKTREQMSRLWIKKAMTQDAGVRTSLFIALIWAVLHLGERVGEVGYAITHIGEQPRMDDPPKDVESDMLPR